MEVEIIRKKVRRVTLRVYPDLRVKVTAPLSYAESKIKSFIESKKSRIEKTKEHMQKAKQEIELRPGEILLHGEPYAFLLEKELGKKVLVDIEDKVIAAGFNLLDGAAQLKRCKAYAKETFLHILNEIGSKHHIARSKLSIRDSQTRWGSCSSVGNISLSRRLIRMPTFVMDYVIAHELAHRHEMNHSKRFRAVVDQLIPDKEKAIQWMKKYGSAIK